MDCGGKICKNRCQQFDHCKVETDCEVGLICTDGQCKEAPKFCQYKGAAHLSWDHVDCQMCPYPTKEKNLWLYHTDCNPLPLSENYVHITLDVIAKSWWNRAFILHLSDEFVVAGGMGMGFELGHKWYFGGSGVVGTNGRKKEIVFAIDLGAGYRVHKAVMILLTFTVGLEAQLQRPDVGDVLVRRSTNVGMGVRFYPGISSQRTGAQHFFLQMGCGGGWMTQPPQSGFANAECALWIGQEIPLR